MNRITGRYETYYYSCRDGFYVQIELDKEDDQGEIYNCWLWHKDYGTKTFMCGILLESGEIDPLLADLARL